MIAIALKYILATLLAVLPFACAHVLNKERQNDAKKTSGIRQLAGWITRCFPFAKTAFYTVQNFCKNLSKKMRRSDNARKLFSLLLLIVLLIVTYIDFSASESAKLYMQTPPENSTSTVVVSATHFLLYKPVVSDPVALFVCQLISFMLFSYKISDNLLTWISNNWFFLTFTNCLFWAMVAVVDQGWFVLAEVQTIFLMAAIYYPTKTDTPDPKGRMSIPLSQNNKITQLAA